MVEGRTVRYMTRAKIEIEGTIFLISVFKKSLTFHSFRLVGH
jgi:hypothetical protein